MRGAPCHREGAQSGRAASCILLAVVQNVGPLETPDLPRACRRRDRCGPRWLMALGDSRWLAAAGTWAVKPPNDISVLHRQIAAATMVQPDCAWLTASTTGHRAMGLVRPVRHDSLHLQSDQASQRLRQDNMRIAVIHKPYFLPWMGYFSKLLYADVLVLQDNVLASNRVWVNRSKIIRPDGQPGYITLPIGEKGDTPICDIELPIEARQQSARRISMSIEHAYARSRCFSEWGPIKEQFCSIMRRYARLVDIDLALIEVLLQALRLPQPDIRLTSGLMVQADPLSTLISNCRETGCDALILGGGNTEWSMEDTERLRAASIEPLFHNFYAVHPEYYQTRRERLGFCRGLSILDCLLNEGPETTVLLLKSVPLSKDEGRAHDDDNS